MKKALLVSLVVLAILGSAFVWFWRIGTPPTLAASTAHLEDVTGIVELRSGATSAWTPAINGQEVAVGTQIRTGSTGSVTLTVSGVSQTRLSTSTEISVDTLILPQNEMIKSQTGLTLVAGRTWSRIVRLLELDSSYTVTTDDVVATVRGTTFETIHNVGQETWIAVHEGNVKAADQIISNGNGMRAAGGVMKFMSSMEALPLNREWTMKNTEADQQFLRETQVELQKQLIDGTGSMYQMLGRPAEQLHMALANPQEKAVLADKYLGRRLAWAKEQEERGELTKSTQALAEVKTDMMNWAVQLPTQPKEELFKRAMTQSSVLYQNVLPEAPGAFLKDAVDQAKTELIQPKQDPLNQPITQFEKLVPQTFVPREPAPVFNPVPEPKPVLMDPNLQQIEPSRLLVPEKLILTSPATTLKSEGLTSVSALVLYSNGTRRDVTKLATFVSSDPSIALVNGTMIQANDKPGSITLTAHYRENGVSVTASLMFDVRF